VTRMKSPSPTRASHHLIVLKQVLRFYSFI